MKIKLLTGRVGIGFAQSAGDVIDVDDQEGARMVQTGLAAKVEEAKMPQAKQPGPHTRN